MMRRWRITIRVWPHSTGKGRDADVKSAGADDGDLYFYVTADDFKEASKCAFCVAQGVEANPAVWKANIIGVAVYDDRESVEAPAIKRDE